MASFENMSENLSTAEFCAEKIYGAATDGTNQMRYLVGPDAEQIYGARATMSEPDFFNMIRNMLGTTQPAPEA